MRLVFQFPASITSVVDAPRLVSSDASPTRPECAVIRLSTPAVCAAAVNRNPIICADKGTTRSAGSGLVAVRSVRSARATPPSRTARPLRSCGGGAGAHAPESGRPSPSAQRSALTSLRRIPAHGQQSSDHRIDTPALKSDLLGLDAAPARPVAGDQHGRQVRGPERPRLSSPPISGSPPVAGQHPGRTLAGRGRLPGQLRAEARRGDRRRSAPRCASRIVELGEVRSETRIVELAPLEPSVELAERAGVGPPCVRADGGYCQVEADGRF